MKEKKQGLDSRSFLYFHSNLRRVRNGALQTIREKVRTVDHNNTVSVSHDVLSTWSVNAIMCFKDKRSSAVLKSNTVSIDIPACQTRLV